MNIVRKYKCYKLTGEVDDKSKEIFDFVDNIISNLILFKYKDFPSYTFYMSSDGKWILEHDLKNETLYVRYDGFWKVLETKYKILYYDIKTILKYMIEKKLQEISICESQYTYSYILHNVEDAFKIKI